MIELIQNNSLFFTINGELEVRPTINRMDKFRFVSN